MMLDIDFSELREGMLQYVPIGVTIGAILLLELFLVLGAWVFSPETAELAAAKTPPPSELSNTEAIGQLLYTKYVYLFQAAGVVLLIAMIGAIVLTLRHKPGVKRQVIADQVARTPQTAIEMKNVKPGQGI